MNSKTLAGWYAWAIRVAFLVIPFLSVWISTSMFFPYITGRNFAFRILVEVALVLWLGLIAIDKSYRPKKSPILWAVLGFTLIVALADFLGVDAYNSFWSRFERMEGLMMILHLAAYFVMLTTVFREKKHWNFLFNAVVLAGTWAGIYGVLQLLGVKQAIQGGGVRIDGTIGNPTYFAAYLSLVIGLATILLFNSDKRWQKYLYGSAVAFFAFIMFFTASRGATLALLVSIPLALVLYLLLKRNTTAPRDRFYKKIVVGALIAMVLIPTFVWLIRDTSLVQNSTVLSRITSVSFQERTIRSRFQIWGMAWQAFLERPILGWGQENFIYAFAKYFDPRLFDQEPWFDRPHNIFFEWLINAGLFGVVSYLALFVALFWSVRKLFKANKIGVNESLVLFVLPVAYFLQNFFVFDNFNTYVLFFSLLAYVNSRLTHEEKPAESTPAQDPMPSVWAVSGAGLGMIFVIYFCNIVPALQAKSIIDSLIATASQTGDPVTLTLNSFKKAIAYDSFGHGEALEQLSRTAGLLIGQPNIPNNVKIPFLQYTMQQLQTYLKKNPLHVRLHLMQASLFQAARVFNQEFVYAAREEIKTALALSPTKQQILFMMADNYLITGENDKALELMQKAVDLAPINRDAQVNLAVVAVLAERNDVVPKVLEALDKIRKTVPVIGVPNGALWNYIKDLDRVASIYIQVGQKTKAREIYNRILSLKKDVETLKVNPSEYQGILQGIDDRIRE